MIPPSLSFPGSIIWTIPGLSLEKSWNYWLRNWLWKVFVFRKLRFHSRGLLFAGILVFIIDSSMTSPSDIDFWASRYRDKSTPWDKGGPHPELLLRLSEGAPELSPPPGGRALVPGCGRGWDAIALAKSGWEVLAVDIVQELEKDLSPTLSQLGGEFRQGNALESQTDAFELIFDHTFFCALPPGNRADWGRMVKNCLAPGGFLVSIVFPVNRPLDEGGPPWRMTLDDVKASLEGFPLGFLECSPVRERSPERAWDEQWAVFRAPCL